MPPRSSIRGHEDLNLKNFHFAKGMEWAKEYGPVYRLNLNFTDVVVLSNVKSIKNFCKNTDGLYRSGCFVVGRDFCKGLATLNGNLWAANKRYCMSVLRDLGFAKTSMEERMMTWIYMDHHTEDFRKLERKIGETKGQPVFVRPYILTCVVSNIISFFYSSGLPGEIAALGTVTSILERMRTIMSGGAVIQYLPRLFRNLLYHIPFTRNGKVQSIMDEMDSFVKANEDIVVDEFVIPKGTVVLFNFWAAHYDTEIWEEPNRFNPDRFLDKDGTFLPQKLENVIPFAVGGQSHHSADETETASERNCHKESARVRGRSSPRWRSSFW
ncbi:hypothetical protein V5799_015342 [Amblyomma americanum]|uniref:Cytochrome n=1 Tax=Amblyomma americanum TaxID=6943 RepID=A0AAQ4E0F3_AMBAM